MVPITVRVELSVTNTTERLQGIEFILGVATNRSPRSTPVWKRSAIFLAFDFLAADFDTFVGTYFVAFVAVTPAIALRFA